MDTNSNTYKHAQLCCSSAPESLKAGFVLSGALILLEVIYYSFELFKEWKAGACNSSTPRDSVAAAFIGGEDQFSPAMTRQATRRVKRANRHVRRKHGRNYNSDENEQINEQELAKHMLSYTMKVSSLDVASCCDEPVSVEIESIEQ